MRHADRTGTHSSREQQSQLVAYDENLLDRSRTQWQFGDWDSLTQLDRGTLQHHPDRAKLALLAAAGHQALGSASDARNFTRLALDWGCSKKMVSQILIAGVHNTLGRAAAVGNQANRALRHFTAAIETGAPASPASLLTPARARHQLELLGLVQGALPAIISAPSAAPHTSSAPAWLSQRARECLLAEDVHNAVDDLLASNELTPPEHFWFCLELSDQFIDRKDKLTALHFLEMAREHMVEADESMRSTLMKKFISLGQAGEAADIAVNATLGQASALELSPEEKAALQAAYEKNRSIANAKSEHGHELLLAYLQTHLSDISMAAAVTAAATTAPDRQLVLVEIGTTRESVPGQGSTLKIADFCRMHDMHFITVDMDPHNTRMAADMFAKLGLPFEAVTMKGEDYLRETTREFDFVFLDAYDFDHGGHSALRQSRYEKYLGSPIDDEACHRMHLECAESMVRKLPPHGLVCLDDTWLEAGKWTAKGTLAMPYLLSHDFMLLEARNRAALLAPPLKKASDV